MGQFGDFLVKHHLPQACSTSISPSQKYGLERYTGHTCDEHRFLDPSYTIAPKGAKIRNTEILVISYPEGCRARRMEAVSN